MLLELELREVAMYRPGEKGNNSADIYVTGIRTKTIKLLTFIHTNPINKYHEQIQKLVCLLVISLFLFGLFIHMYVTNFIYFNEGLNISLLIC